jgi:hypothetical protein
MTITFQPADSDQQFEQILQLQRDGQESWQVVGWDFESASGD